MEPILIGMIAVFAVISWSAIDNIIYELKKSYFCNFNYSAGILLFSLMLISILLFILI